MESLDEHVDEDAEAAWAEEIALRLKEVDSGKVAGPALKLASIVRQIMLVLAL